MKYWKFHSIFETFSFRLLGRFLSFSLCPLPLSAALLDVFYSKQSSLLWISRKRKSGINRSEPHTGIIKLFRNEFQTPLTEYKVAGGNRERGLEMELKTKRKSRIFWIFTRNEYFEWQRSWYELSFVHQRAHPRTRKQLDRQNAQWQRPNECETRSTETKIHTLTSIQWWLCVIFHS